VSEKEPAATEWSERPTAGAARPLVGDLEWEEQVAASGALCDCSISLPIKFTTGKLACMHI